MAKRSYGQYCGLANALDLIGERWTLLIVRDLALSPKRFTDLLGGLAGIGTSLLSDRLRTLEDEGLIERAVADRPIGGVVYRLTDAGHALARAMSPLANWGATRLVREEGDEFRPEWLTYALRNSFNAAAAVGVHDCYEFRLEGTAFFIVVDDGSMTVCFDPPRPPDIVVTTDIPTLAQLGEGLITSEEAAASGRASFEGDPDAGARALAIFGARSSRSRERRASW